MNLNNHCLACIGAIKRHWIIWSIAAAMIIIMRLVFQPNYIVCWTLNLWSGITHLSDSTGLAPYWKIPSILQLILTLTLYYLQQTLPQRLFAISRPNLEPIAAGSILCGAIVGFFQMATGALTILIPALGCISLFFILRTFYHARNFPACLFMASLSLTLSCFYIITAMSFFHELRWIYSLPFLIVAVCFLVASLKVTTIEPHEDQPSAWRSLAGTCLILLCLYPGFSYPAFLQQLSSAFADTEPTPALSHTPDSP